MSLRSHVEKHLRTSAHIRDIVLGASDGLTVPFALAAGLAGTVDSNHLILTAGIAEIVAGSVSMGLGGYLAGRTEIEHYASELDREYREIDEIPVEEENEVRMVLEDFGLSATAREEVLRAIVSDRDRWVNFMMRFELGIEKPETSRPAVSALRIGASYAGGGVIALLGYFFTEDPMRGLTYSAIATTIALGVFGFIKARILGQSPWQGAYRTVGIGVAAATVAYFVARAIGG